MKKYTRKFGSEEKQIRFEKPQNILEDLKQTSGSIKLVSLFYKISKIKSSLFQFFSIYVLSKK